MTTIPGYEMILPDPDVHVGTMYAFDLRLPDTPAPSYQASPPRPLAADRKDPRCPAGLHLWYAVEAHRDTPVMLPNDGDVEAIDRHYWVALTCVSCGIVTRLHNAEIPGPSSCEPTQLEPVPLRCGALRAQEISHIGYRYGTNRRRWAVYREDQRIGLMATDQTLRGRHYVVGLLAGTDSRWEAPTPRGCLQKLYTATQQAPHPPAPDTHPERTQP